MFELNQPLLINILGHAGGALIFAIFLCLLFSRRGWSGSRGRFLSGLAGGLGLLWNLGSLLVLAWPGLSPHALIPLPYGGSIVIEQTEALVAIDVNSGNFRRTTRRGHRLPDELARRQGDRPAAASARPGGVIVNDFIDMRDEKHRRAVEKAMRDAVQRDGRGRDPESPRSA